MEMCSMENPFGKTTGIIRLYNSSNGIGAPDLNKFKREKTKRETWSTNRGFKDVIEEDLGTEEASGIAPMVAVAGVRLTNKLFGNIDLETNVGVQLGYETSHNFSKDLPIGPIANMEIVYNKKGSFFDGARIGILPAGDPKNLTVAMWSAVLKKSANFF